MKIKCQCNTEIKYKIRFIAANGLVSTTYFDNKHTIYFRNNYLEVEREIMGSPRVVYSVREERICKVWRYGKLVFQQYVGYLGGH